MRKFLKWFGIMAGGLLGIALILVVVLFFVGSLKVNRTYDEAIASVSVPTDAASVAGGKQHLEAVGVCQVCHGQYLAGPVVANCKDNPCTGFSDDAFLGKVMPKNLTSGRGGISGVFSDEDYVRAIRHGIGKDGEALVIMPAEEYNKILKQRPWSDDCLSKNSPSGR